MSPTFQLALGVPGASSALAVARRFGMPSTVIERAERFLSREALTFDEMVEKLAGRAAGARARARRPPSARPRRRARGSAELDREIERLATKERAAVTREGEALLASLKSAREDLRAAQARLRGGKPTEEDVRAATRAIDAVAHKTSIGGELEPGAAADAVERAPVPAGRDPRGAQGVRAPAAGRGADRRGARRRAAPRRRRER